MPKLFGIDIAGQVKQAMASGLLPATLTVVTSGTRTSGQLTAGTNPTDATYSCRGVMDTYGERQIDGTTIQAGDRIVTILAATLQAGIVPKPGDFVTIESQTLKVINMFRDPAAATYRLQARRG